MEYTVRQIKERVSQFGEAMLVMKSDREYTVHGKQNIQYHKPEQGEIRVEGMNESGEYIIAVLPVDEIEHVYTHREI